HIANQGRAVPNSSLPFASKPIAVTSISSRDEQTLVTTRTEVPAGSNPAGRSPATPQLLNNPKPVAEPINRPPSIATSASRQLPTSPMGKPIIERGVQSQGGPAVTLPQPINKS